MFKLESFCLRQFVDPEYTGTQVKYDKEAFEAKINALYKDGKCELVDGYVRARASNNWTKTIAMLHFASIYSLKTSRILMSTRWRLLRRIVLNYVRNTKREAPKSYLCTF